MNYVGQIAFIVTIFNDYENSFMTLIEAGVDVNLALFWAATLGHQVVARKLIDMGADVNVSIDDGSTALISTVKNGEKHCLELLINAGADVNKACNEGTAPLIWATQKEES